MSNKGELIKALMVAEPLGVREQKYLKVFDGTGEMQPKGDATMTTEVNGKYYYIPFVGTLYKSKFPELVNLENREITDKETIQKIKENLF